MNNAPQCINNLKETKLSLLLQTCFGIGQIRFNDKILENYRRTLRVFLNEIQHDPNQRELYVKLRNIAQVYQTLSEVIEKQALIKNEYLRLKKLGLPPKTIERRLKMEWSDPCIVQPITKLVHAIKKAMKTSDELDTFEMMGCQNSLMGVLRQLESEKNKKRKLIH